MSPTTVPITDIAHRVQITGWFARPIGEYLVLDGTRVGATQRATKSGPGDVRVERLNGAPHQEPRTIWVQKLANVPAGTPCYVEGYETGGMIGLPDEVIHRNGGMAPQAGWQFHVEFVPLRVHVGRS